MEIRIGSKHQKGSIPRATSMRTFTGNREQLKKGFNNEYPSKFSNDSFYHQENPTPRREKEKDKNPRLTLQVDRYSEFDENFENKNYTSRQRNCAIEVNQDDQREHYSKRDTREYTRRGSREYSSRPDIREYNNKRDSREYYTTNECENLDSESEVEDSPKNIRTFSKFKAGYNRSEDSLDSQISRTMLADEDMDKFEAEPPRPGKFYSKCSKVWRQASDCQKKRKALCPTPARESSEEEQTKVYKKRSPAEKRTLLSKQHNISCSAIENRGNSTNSSTQQSRANTLNEGSSGQNTPEIRCTDCSGKTKHEESPRFFDRKTQSQCPTPSHSSNSSNLAVSQNDFQKARPTNLKTSVPPAYSQSCRVDQQNANKIRSKYQSNNPKMNPHSKSFLEPSEPDSRADQQYDSQEVSGHGSTAELSSKVSRLCLTTAPSKNESMTDLRVNKKQPNDLSFHYVDLYLVIFTCFILVKLTTSLFSISKISICNVILKFKIYLKTVTERNQKFLIQ